MIVVTLSRYGKDCCKLQATADNDKNIFGHPTRAGLPGRRRGCDGRGSQGYKIVSRRVPPPVGAAELLGTEAVPGKILTSTMKFVLMSLLLAGSSLAMDDMFKKIMKETAFHTFNAACFGENWRSAPPWRSACSSPPPST